MLRTDFEKQTEEEERGLKSDPFFSSYGQLPKCQSRIISRMSF